jgi:hypothetical protein
MKTLIAALSLSLLSNVAQADGFAPWNARTVPAEPAGAAAAVVPPIGFAPWRDLSVPADAIDTTARISANGASAFRPWSVAS